MGEKGSCTNTVLGHLFTSMYTYTCTLMMTVGPLFPVLLIDQETPWHKLDLELYAKFGYQCLKSMCSLVLGWEGEGPGHLRVLYFTPPALFVLMLPWCWSHNRWTDVTDRDRLGPLWVYTIYREQSLPLSDCEANKPYPCWEGDSFLVWIISIRALSSKTKNLLSDYEVISCLTCYVGGWRDGSVIKSTSAFPSNHQAVHSHL